MELKRLLNIKYIIIVCAALVLNIILFMFQATAGGNKINEDSKRDLRIRTEYIENYKSNIQNIVDRAEKLKKQRLFSNPESFSYKNIIKTGKDYEKLININLSADNSKAVRAISKYSMFIGISAILTLLLMNNLFKERDNNMWQLTYMSKNGRVYLGLVRIADIFIISLIQHFLLYITVVFTSFILFGGLGDLYNPIQNISEFGQCTLVINKAEYLIADFLLTYLSVVVATSIIYMLMNVFRNRKNVFIGTGAFLIIEYFIYINTESQSIYRLLKYINICNLFRINTIYMEYINVNVFSHVVSLRYVLITAVIILSVMMFMISVLVYVKRYPNTEKGIMAKISDKINVEYQKIFNNYNNLFKEIHKTLLTSKGIWLIAAAIFAAVYFSTTGYVTFNDLQIQNDKLYKEHGGKDYTYIKNYVDSVLEKTDNANKERIEAQKKYDNGEIDFEEYFAAVSNYNSVSNSSVEIAEPMEKLSYLAKLKKETGIDGYIMSDRGYEQIFGKQSTVREIILLMSTQFAVMLIAFASVYIEKKSSMDKLINSSSGGFKYVNKKKLISVGLITLLLTLAVNIIEYTNLIRYYKVTYFQAPVQSLTFMGDIKINVSIIGWLLLLIVFKLIISTVTFSVTFIITRMVSKWQH